MIQLLLLRVPRPPRRFVLNWSTRARACDRKYYHFELAMIIYLATFTSRVFVNRDFILFSGKRDLHNFDEIFFLDIFRFFQFLNLCNM